MPNMSYCRFHNTKSDLRDCLDNFWNIDSSSEAKARKRLVAIAKQIIAEYESNPDEVDSESFADDDYIESEDESDEDTER